MLRRGWLRTGDVGHLDPEGYLHLTDRLTDVIVSGGENVYGAVVEQALCAHQAVADAAVVGVPDARWGETVHAAVVLSSGGRGHRGRAGRVLPRTARRGGAAALGGVPVPALPPTGVRARSASQRCGNRCSGQGSSGRWRGCECGKRAARVCVSVDGPVATITFNRPEKLNAA